MFPDELDMKTEEVQAVPSKYGPEKFTKDRQEGMGSYPGNLFSHAGARAPLFPAIGTHDLPFLSPERARQ